MLRKIVRFIVFVPLAIVIVLFALANRQVVTVSLDPFGGDPPSFSLTAPLFIVLLLCALAGIIIGGVAAWIRQSKWRRAAREFQAEARSLAAELRARNEQRGTAALPFDASRAPPAA